MVCGAGRAAAIGRGAGVRWVLLDGRNESRRAGAASNNDEGAGRLMSLDGKSARHRSCLGARGRKLKHVELPWACELGESKLGCEESEADRESDARGEQSTRRRLQRGNGGLLFAMEESSSEQQRAVAH